MRFRVTYHKFVRLLLSIIILASSIFSFAQNSNSSCQQIEDVIDNGCRYMQFVFVDSQGHYTAGYLESYDDPSKGSLFYCIHPISVLSKRNVQMQQLQQFHTASIARMKQQAVLRSPVTQRQQVDQLFLQKRIDSVQARAYYQQIEYAQLIAQAQKQAKKIRKEYRKKSFHISFQELKMEYELHNYALNNVDTQDSLFQKNMHDRTKAYELSLKNQIPKTKQYKINAQTVAFLQTQGIDAVHFEKVDGLDIQHQVTKELIDILDTIADYAVHNHELYQKNLTKYFAHLASVTQQSNLERALQQTIHGTNCCHGILHYLKGMVSSVGQAYQQFQTALDYFDMVADTYRNLILKHAVQGAATAYCLESMVTAGMIAAPTVTVAAAGIIIGITTYVMAPLCLQGLANLKDFGGACIVGNWDKIISDLDNFGTFISSKETVAYMAELAGGSAVSTPNLHYVIDQILSLRPVVISVQNASGEMVQSLYLMTKNQIQKVYKQSIELLQLPEFINFKMKHDNIWELYFFDILPKSHPALVVAFADNLEISAMNSVDQALITNLFSQVEGSQVGNIIKVAASSVGSQVAQGLLSTDFSVTQVGKRMLQVITKPYEEIIFKNIAKDYSKLILNQAPKETLELFCRCHEISIVPQKISTDIERLHMMFKDKYLGLQEFSSENPYLTMQMRHIFYPNLQPKFNENYLFIKEFKLNGFHHDEYSVLEKAGTVKWKDKMHGKAEFGAEECFISDIDFGDGIICKGKTFFPSSWSREKVAQVIFEASQNRIELIDKSKEKLKFECRRVNNMFIDIIIDNKNVITSAYPSKKNFRI